MLVYYISLCKARVLKSGKSAFFMEIIYGIDQLKCPIENAVVTLGNFDGVHLGHQKIFARVKEEARRLNGRAVVITFEPHPLKILLPEKCPPLLSPLRKKLLLLEKSGIDVVLCIPFSMSFSEISPAEFVRDMLIAKIGAKKVIVGYNYHFGKGKGGDVRTLRELCEPEGVEVEVVQALTVEQTSVSSSKIRELIREGRVEEASKLLGRDYPIIGKVVVGKKRGRSLGFPTANLEISDELYPRTGVYAVEVVWNGQHYEGVANVGFNPTFSPQAGAFSLEVYILDFTEDLYGQEIQVRFKKRIRDEQRFDSAAKLIDRIQKDIEWAKRNVFTKTAQS
jgi:riboflavin kinase / FMN adenylyltransferase